MILIVGAGISGLYTGYELLKKGFSPIILEKEKIGGKLISNMEDRVILEYGPSVLNSNQKHILTLCSELGVELKRTEGDFYSFTKLVDEKNLKEKAGSVKDHLNWTESSTFYESEDMLFNDWLKSVKNEGHYLYPVKGFSFLIERLKDILQPYIKFGEVSEVLTKENHVEVKIDNKYKIFEKIILCTTMTQLKSIKFSNYIVPTGLTKRMSSLRVYVKLKSKAEDLNKIFKNRVIYYFGGLCIKISKDILLLIYTDGKNTKMKSDDNIKRCLTFFGLEKEVEKIISVFFLDAYDVIISKNDLHFKLNKNIYTSAFPDRYNQAWIEGNLLQCKKILDDLEKN